MSAPKKAWHDEHGDCDHGPFGPYDCRPESPSNLDTKSPSDKVLLDCGDEDCPSMICQTNRRAKSPSDLAPIDFAAAEDLLIQFGGLDAIKRTVRAAERICSARGDEVAKSPSDEVPTCANGEPMITDRDPGSLPKSGEALISDQEVAYRNRMNRIHALRDTPEAERDETDWNLSRASAAELAYELSCRNEHTRKQVLEKLDSILFARGDKWSDEEIAEIRKKGPGDIMNFVEKPELLIYDEASDIDLNKMVNSATISREKANCLRDESTLVYSDEDENIGLWLTPQHDVLIDDLYQKDSEAPEATYDWNEQQENMFGKAMDAVRYFIDNNMDIGVAAGRVVHAMDAIASEREYQQRLWADGDLGATVANADTRSIDEWTLYISRYAHRLMADNASSEEDRLDKLTTVRKIAALCVACMEDHGAPRRESA